jgi:alpha-galactosidase
MSHMDIGRNPDRVIAQRGHEWLRLDPVGDVWRGGDLAVAFVPGAGGLAVRITAGDAPLSRIVCLWREKPGDCKVLNDHWERGYGDLAWSNIAPERPLPWYFLTHSDGVTHGYGVKTGPSALCCWLLDASCVRLVLDVRNGGEGVVLGGRTLEAATIVHREGREGEDAFDAAHAFCRQMCDRPALPTFPVYGGNNWYYAYGHCSHASIVEDSRWMSELAGGAGTRPFMVIDAGWHTNTDEWHRTDDEPWADGAPHFPDMAATAAAMKAEGVHTGLWFRPLLTSRATPEEWLLRTNRTLGKDTQGRVLDPSLPEVLERIGSYMRRFRDWGFELCKHDFTSFDILGRYGFACGLHLTEGGWHFADRTRTTAEIVLSLYHALKDAAPGMLTIGCNTFSHLSAGIFEIQRTGDDTSGRQWERTRRMGPNTLAFRMPQHGAFYAADADCVGLTNHVPWRLNRQWMDVLGHSGTVALVSADPKALGEEQKAAIREMFRAASTPRAPSRPLDWLHTNTPSSWREADGTVKTYEWVDEDRLESMEGMQYEEM